MNKRKGLASLIILTSVAFAGCLLGTAAWFVPSVNVEEYNIEGKSAGAYFHSGNGSAENPFIITQPRHLYNLAWLQYCGTFNKDKNSDGVIDKQYYFKLDDSLQASGLDMDGWTLPPIGTETYPFVGNFDGNNVAIKNLNVSNATNLSHPSGINYSDYPEIIGFFGVVGELDGTPAFSYDTSKNELIDFTLNNLTVESKTSQTLIGLAAGYVNGEMSGVKVSGNATLDVNNQASTARTDISSKLSDYGLVGYSTKQGTNGSYTQDLSEFYNSGEASGSGTSDFGGSIAFADFAERIHNLFKSGGAATTMGYRSSSGSSASAYYKYFSKKDASNNLISSISVYRGGSGGKTYLEQDPSNANGNLNNSTNYGYLVFNMLNAQNVTNKWTGAGAVNPIPLPGTVQPLQMNDDHEPTDKNTGYIVAGGNSYNTGKVLLSSFPRAQIVNSLQSDKKYSESELFYAGNIAYNRPVNAIQYDSSKFSILTNNSATYSASNFSLIRDDYHVDAGTNPAISGSSYTVKYYGANDPDSGNAGLNLQRYDIVRTALHEKLDGANNIQSIGFTGETPSSSAVVNAKVKVNGFNSGSTVEYINDFPLIANSLDFNFKKAGYITCVVGSYCPTTPSALTVPASAFTLYKVNRNASYGVTSLQKIEKIYANSDTSSDTKYLLSFNGNAPADAGALLFDTDYIESAPPVKNAVYYFEIPLDVGEYAIGSPNRGCNFLYLDIGANAEAADEYVAYHITTKSNSNPFPLGVDFAVANVTDNGGYSIGVFISASSQGTIVFTVADNGSSITVSSVTSTTLVGSYSFQGTGFNNGFTVSGLSGAPPNDAPGGVRVTTIKTKLLANGNEYTVLIKDNLDTDTSILSTSYYLGAGSNAPTLSDLATIQSTIVSLDSTKIATFRGLTKVVSLTRTSGTAEFTTTYDETNSSYLSHKVDVDITLNGCQVTVGTITSAPSQYHFYVSGVEKTAGNVIS